MNIEVCIRNTNDTGFHYSLQEVLSPSSYQLPSIPRDVLRFTSFTLSSFVIEIDIAPDYKALFLKTLANRIEASFTDNPANAEEITHLAERINSVLPQLADADKEGKFKEKIDELFYGSYLFQM